MHSRFIKIQLSFTLISKITDIYVEIGVTPLILHRLHSNFYKHSESAKQREVFLSQNWRAYREEKPVINMLNNITRRGTGGNYYPPGKLYNWAPLHQSFCRVTTAVWRATLLPEQQNLPKQCFTAQVHFLFICAGDTQGILHDWQVPKQLKLHSWVKTSQIVVFKPLRNTVWLSRWHSCVFWHFTINSSSWSRGNERFSAGERDKTSQCMKLFHFECAMFLLHGLVILNGNSFCVGTIVNHVETCSWRVNVTFLPSNVSGAWWRKSSIIIQNVKVSPFLCLSVNLSVCLSVCLSASHGSFAAMSFSFFVTSANTN